MLFNLSFSLLLASIIFASLSEAAPARRKPGFATLPLKRVPARRDLHPLVLYQQHINRAHGRLARMTGREGPSRREMEEKLVKRIISAGETELVKRYNRQGLPQLQGRYNRQGVSGHNKGNQVPGLTQLQSLTDLDGLNNLHGVLPDDLLSQLTGNNGTASQNSTSTNSNSNIGGADAESALQSGDLTPPTGSLASNSAGLDIEGNDAGYMATFQLGTPPQNYLILVDSGSADFWVASDNCQEVQEGAGGQGGGGQGGGGQGGGGQGGDGGQGDAAIKRQTGGCGNHQVLSAQTSSSFQDTQEPFQVTYGTGAVAGTKVIDNVVFAGLSLTGHTFGTAQQETSDFASDTVPFDGLMGLAQSTLSKQGVLTPVESAAQQGLIAEAITSFKLARQADNNNDGEVTFGGLDETKFDPTTLQTLNNVNPDGFWEADMPAITVNGQDAGLSGRTAILDTGTTLILAPADDATTVHSLIPGSKTDGQGDFTIPCNSNVSVALTFGNQSFTIDTRDLAFAPVDPNNPDGDCVSGITGGGGGSLGAETWLAGDVFLKNAYFSTNVNKNTVSLAKLV